MVKSLPWKNILIVCLLLCSACQPAATPTSSSVDQKETYSEDELNEAIRQAQDSLYILRGAFLAPKPSYAYMHVKVRFSAAGKRDDMWTQPIEIIGDTFVIQMMEGVTVDNGAHPDRYMNIPSKDIIDWMIMEKDGTVLGGYTLRLEYKYLTPEEQKKYPEVTGYKRFG
ncbi:MAG: DUF2314 domain-containing protein [Anaerolineales bacterium]